jgi:hypothetical protein
VWLRIPLLAKSCKPSNLNVVELRKHRLDLFGRSTYEITRPSAFFREFNKDSKGWLGEQTGPFDTVWRKRFRYADHAIAPGAYRNHEHPNVVSDRPTSLLPVSRLAGRRQGRGKRTPSRSLSNCTKEI